MRQPSRRRVNLLNLAGSISWALAGLFTLAVGSLTGCAHGRSVVIECPRPSPGVSVDLMNIMLVNGTVSDSSDAYLYDDLLVWVGEIGRHCAAVSESLE